MSPLKAVEEKREVEEVEIRLLLEGIRSLYGFNLADYSPNSLRRRIRNFIREEKLKCVSRLQERVLHDHRYMERLLLSLFVNVTSMFRDPTFYRTFRKEVLPSLRDLPFPRIWHAGCSTGEEVYSMAILLQEEDLYERCRIYATDINGSLLETAKEGAFPLSSMKENTTNYIEAGGKTSFSEFYIVNDTSAVMLPSLRRNMVFAQHDLGTDRSFNEFDVILCRNVMIYFNKLLQARAHNLLYESLKAPGFLGLGNNESVRFTPHESCYEALATRDKIYRKVK